MSYDIGGWHFDPAEPVLRGVDGERRLEDRAARVLALLCRRRGAVVSKDELIAEVWGGRSVSGNSVSIVMGSLRRALDDDPADPRIIVTVARRGYRLVGGARPVIDPLTRPAARSIWPVRRRFAWMIVAASSTIALAMALRPADPPALAVEVPRNATGLHALDPLAASLAPVVVHGVGRLPDIRLLDGAGAGTPRVIVRSSLILWNGAPELALSATDATTHTVIWSSFAAGPPALLARHVEERIATLASRLPR